MLQQHLFHPQVGKRNIDVRLNTKATQETLSAEKPDHVILALGAEPLVIPIPGGSTSQVAAVPLEWVVDAVEVFSGTSSSNSKRLAPSLDAGYVTLSDTYLGHTLFRHTDEELSVAAGYEVLKDTNNSSVDFYERETQSLHD